MVIDDKGRAVQTTRSWDTVRPGEKKACKGCHAKQDANFYEFKKEDTQAWAHGVQQLQPFYGPSRGFSFIKEVQPILDAKCVSCHDGSKDGVMSLNGAMKSRGTTEQRLWSDSYLNLTHAKKEEVKHWKSYAYFGDPENEVVNWISKMSRPTEMPPYSYGAAKSKMMHILEDGHYDVKLTEEEFHKMAAWLDLLVPFVGDYREAGDWSDEDMAYYDYYEHKRGRHYQEELENIKQWIEADGHTKVQKFDDGEINGYRALEGQITKSSDTAWKIDFANKVMIDMIELVGEAEITFSDNSVVSKRADLPTLKLEVPKEIQGLSIKSATPLAGVKIWGLSEAELPHHNDYNPYKRLGEALVRQELNV